MRVVLGIDGGGTKTDCVLMDESGKILARVRSGPSNPSRIGVDAALTAILEAADKALADSGNRREQVASISAALAGVSNDQVRAELTPKLRVQFPIAMLFVSTDLSMALAATGEMPSVVVIAGTGSAVFGRDASGTLAREGGLGPVLGDPGSAYDIGRMAAARALQQWHDGEQTRLGEEILRALQCDWVELQEHIRTDAENTVPKIFPVVVQLANEGDGASHELLEAAAADLAKLVNSVIDRLHLRDSSFFLAKTGGVFGRSAHFDDAFDRLVSEAARHVRIGPLPKPVAEFAAETALKAIGKVALPVGDSGGARHLAN